MKKYFAIIMVILLAITACLFTACDGETGTTAPSTAVEDAEGNPSGTVDPDKDKDPNQSNPGEGESGGEEDPSGEGEGEGGSHQDDHVHSFYWVEGHDATCFETGEEDHYVCSECGKTFDLNYEECDDFTIQRLAHDFYEPVTGYAATCDSDGMLDYKTCRLCGNTFDLDGNPIETIVIPAGHIYGEWIEPRESNCTEEGVIGHYECQRCHLMFDESGEIIYDTVIPVSHLKTYVNYKPSTCTEDGYLDHYECTRCGAWLNNYDEELDPEDLVIPASHQFNWRSAREADCWRTGCVEHYYCTACEKYFDTDYNELGDDYSAVFLNYHHSALSDWIPEKAVTCVEDGVIGHYHCSNCDYDLDTEMNRIDDVVIKATGHEFEGTTCQKCGKTIVQSTGLATESNGDGTCKVVGIGTFEGTELVIPEKIGDDTVTEIAAAAFSNCTDLTLIYVPESVLEIGESAFAGCSSLETLIIPFVGASRTIEKERDTNKKYLGYMFSHDSFEGSYRVQENYSYVDYGSYTATYTRYIPISLKDVVVMDGDIPYSFCGCRELRSVILGAGVESVGKSAFLGCLNMLSIKVGEGVTRIEDNAFNSCNSLKTLVVPSGLTYIGDVTFPASILIEYEGGKYFGNEENPYLVMTRGSSVIHEDTKFIGKNAFSPNGDWRLEQITSVELPEGLIGISSNAFDYTKATLITLPSTLQYIGYQAFAHASALSSIEIPVGTVIGERAFQDATGLERAVIGGTLSGYMIFSGCENLSSVTVTAEGPETTIGSLAFSGCAIESIVLPARVTGSIERSAFQKCASLVSVECLGNIEIIWNEAFDMCTALESINASPRTIYSSAFSNCQSLKAFDFSNIGTIYDYAFLSCFSLESIEMPETLSILGDYVFAGCRSVTSITGVDNAKFKYVNNCIVYDGTIKAGCRNSVIPQDGSVTGIGAGAFSNMGSISHLTIPASLTWVGSQAFYGCDLETITVAAGNTEYEIIDNCLIRKDDKTLILGCANTVIPTDAEIVTAIGEFAFGRNTKLTSITIPNNITAIKRGAFEYSGLTSISLPDSVDTLGERAFQFCLDLEEVDLGGVKSISEKTFLNCPSLTVLRFGAAMTSISQTFYNDKGELVTPVNSIYIDCDMATYLTKYYHGTICFADAIYVDGELLSGEITIPDGVTSVAESAFDGRPITSVVIPGTVTQLKVNCFASCSELTSITFEGTRAQWDAISKGYDWIGRSATCTVHCTMGGEDVVYNA